MYCAPLGVAYANRPEKLSELAPALCPPSRTGTSAAGRPASRSRSPSPRSSAARPGDRAVIDAVTAVPDREGGEELEYLVEQAGRARPIDGPDMGFTLFTAGARAAARRGAAGVRGRGCARRRARRRHGHERRGGGRAPRRAPRPDGSPRGAGSTGSRTARPSRPRRRRWPGSPNVEHRCGSAQNSRMASPEDPTRGPREERRVITAVFADLVGSTALGERLDPEELKLVVGEAIARMIGAVEAFGGTIKDLAGDGVLALFGAPTAHEDDPERAVRASLRIVEEIADYAPRGRGARGASTGFGVRVGVNTGAGRGGRDRRGQPGRVRGPRRRGERRGPAAVARRAGHRARRRGHVPPGRAACSTWGTPSSSSSRGRPRRSPRSRGARRRSATPSRTRGSRASQAPLIGRERELAAGRDGGRRRPRRHRRHRARHRRARHRQDAAARRAARPVRGRARRSTAAPCGSRDGACPTASPCRTGRSATCCATWLGVLADEPELRVRVALRRQVERLFGARPAEHLPVPRRRCSV